MPRRTQAIFVRRRWGPSRDGIATAAFSCRQSGQSAMGSGAALTGPGPTGIVPELDSSGPADGVWGYLVAVSHLRSEAHGDGELGPDTVERRTKITAGRGHRARQ